MHNGENTRQKRSKMEKNSSVRLSIESGSLVMFDSVDRNVGMENHVQVFYKAIIRASANEMKRKKIDQ